MSALHTQVPVDTLAAPLPVQLPVDAHGKSAEGGPGMWASATPVRDQDGVCGSGLQPDLVLTVNIRFSRWKSYLCLLFSLCHSFFEINRIVKVMKNQVGLRNSHILERLKAT